MPNTTNILCICQYSYSFKIYFDSENCGPAAVIKCLTFKVSTPLATLKAFPQADVKFHQVVMTRYDMKVSSHVA